MRTVKMFDIGEEVMIKVEIADIKVVKGEIKYVLKDPLTAKTYDYLYTDEQICEVSRPKPTTKTVRKSSGGAKGNNAKK